MSSDEVPLLGASAVASDARPADDEEARSSGVISCVSAASSEELGASSSAGSSAASSSASSLPAPAGLATQLMAATRAVQAEAALLRKLSFERQRNKKEPADEAPMHEAPAYRGAAAPAEEDAVTIIEAFECQRWSMMWRTWSHEHLFPTDPSRFTDRLGTEPFDSLEAVHPPPHLKWREGAEWCLDPDPAPRGGTDPDVTRENHRGRWYYAFNFPE